MTKGLVRTLLFGAMLFVAPTVGMAYIDCVTIINVWPNGAETHCVDCIIYNNTTGQQVGEITNCDQSALPGRGPV